MVRPVRNPEAFLRSNTENSKDHLLRARRSNDKYPSRKEIPELETMGDGDDYAKYRGDLLDKKNPNYDNQWTLLRLGFCVISGFQVP